MSEKKNYTHEDLIWVDISNRNVFGGLIKKEDEDSLDQFDSDIYILKSKYDELSLENARLAADLAKVEAELKECKGGFTKQIDEFYELRKVTIDTINQRNELLIENTKLKAELKMKIAGGGGGDKPLEGTGGIAYGVGGEVPKDKIILFSGGAGGESNSEQKIEDNPDFTQKGGDFMSGKSENVLPPTAHGGTGYFTETSEGAIYVSQQAYNELSNELTKVEAELEKVKESKEYKHTIKCSLPELTEKQKEQLSQLTKEATHVLTIDLNGHHIMQTIEEYNQQNKPTK